MKRKKLKEKKCVIKRQLTFKNYKDCLFNDKIILKSNKDLKVIVTMYIQKKSIKLRKVLMMIRDYKHLIKLLRIHMEKMQLKCARAKL